MMIFIYLAIFFVAATAQNYGLDGGSELKGNQQFCFNLNCPNSLPKTCKDVMSSEPSVLVTLWSGIKVRCDTQSDGGGWTIIQRRTSGDLDFQRDWEEYKEGFGNVADEFWLGNENIHRISSRSPHELRIDFQYNEQKYFARYTTFRVLSEDEGYTLQVDGYSGNAGDSLTKHNNYMFTTLDRDNDISDYVNCAQSYHGGWWYHKCHQSNLNGQWNTTTFAEGVVWRQLTEYNDSVTFTEMKIRPIN